MSAPRKAGPGGGRSSGDKRALKDQLFGKQYRRKCCFCRCQLTRETATLEHVIPLSERGGWAIENLKLSCAPCNQDRGSTPFEEYLTRVAARPAASSTKGFKQDPALVAALARRG